VVGAVVVVPVTVNIPPVKEVSQPTELEVY